MLLQQFELRAVRHAVDYINHLLPIDRSTESSDHLLQMLQGGFIENHVILIHQVYNELSRWITGLNKKKTIQMSKRSIKVNKRLVNVHL